MLHRRNSNRLPHYDYSRAGYYFITVCTKNREHSLGEVVNHKVQMSLEGDLIKEIGKETVAVYGDIKIDCWVVMPNHIHVVLKIGNMLDRHVVGAIHELPLQNAPETYRKERRVMLIPKIIGRFKMLTTKRINIERKTPGWKVWQRGYWDRVVRDDEELHRIREYIRLNPMEWERDSLNNYN